MANPCPWSAPIWTDSLSEHFYTSCTGTDHPQYDADRRSFSRAIETEKTVDLTGLDTKADRVDCQHLAEAFCQLVGFDCIVGHWTSVPQINFRSLHTELNCNLSWFSIGSRVQCMVRKQKASIEDFDGCFAFC